jgi:hypothetical protein
MGEAMILLILGLVILLAGAVMLVVGIRQLGRRRRGAALRATRGEIVAGAVTGSTRNRRSKSNIAVHTVEFTDRTGAKRTVRSATGSLFPPRTGTQMSVWYDPDDVTAEPMIVGDWRESVMAVGLLVVGGVFALVGLIVLLGALAA